MAALVFGAYVVVGFVVLMNAPRGNLWFAGDDWGLLIGRSLSSPDDWLRPQNDHWSTVPIVVYQVLFGLFGLRSFAAYQVVIVMLHLSVAVMVRVIMRRNGVAPWIATFAAGTLVLAGSISANIFHPIQISQVGSLAFGLGYLLVVDRDGPLDRRDVGGLALAVVALAASGVGPIMCLVVVGAVFLRRGWQPAIVHFVVTMGIYLGWEMLYPATGTSLSEEMSLADRVTTAASWVYDGTTGGLERISWTWVGAVALTALVAAGVIAEVGDLGWRRMLRTRAAAISLALGGPLALAAISTQRVLLGEEGARAERYSAIVIVGLLPMAAIAVDRLGRRRPAPTVLLLVPLFAGVPGNVGALWKDPPLRGDLRPLFAAAVESPVARVVRPDVRLEPHALTADEVTIGWLLDAADRGRLPDAPALTDSIREVATMRLSISRRTPTPPATSVCQVHDRPVVLALRQGDVVGIAEPMSLRRVVGSGAFGPRVRYASDPVWSPADQLVVEVPDITVQFDADDGSAFELCTEPASDRDPDPSTGGQP